MLIAMHGQPGSGKDTVAQFLKDEYQFHVASFAAPLRREVAAAFRLSDEDVKWFEDRENKERPLKRLALEECDDPGFIACVADRVQTGRDQIAELLAGRSYRWILQRWGTEYRRGQSPTYWVDRADEAIAGRGRTVFTDCRFPNEAEFVRSKGGALWHIFRPGLEGANAHASNQQLAFKTGEDLYIRNGGDIPGLRRVVIDLMRNVYKLEALSHVADRTGR